MSRATRVGREARTEARRLADLVEEAIDDGATTVEKVHKAIASLPLDILQELDVFEETVKEVRKVQDTSIGAIYDVIRKINHEAGKLATRLLQRRREGLARKAVHRRAATAHAA